MKFRYKNVNASFKVQMVSAGVPYVPAYLLPTPTIAYPTPNSNEHLYVLHFEAVDLPLPLRELDGGGVLLVLGDPVLGPEHIQMHLHFLAPRCHIE